MHCCDILPHINIVAIYCTKILLWSNIVYMCVISSMLPCYIKIHQEYLLTGCVLDYVHTSCVNNHWSKWSQYKAMAYHTTWTLSANFPFIHLTNLCLSLSNRCLSNSACCFCCFLMCSCAFICFSLVSFSNAAFLNISKLLLLLGAGLFGLLDAALAKLDHEPTLWMRRSCKHTQSTMIYYSKN